jgi:ankyrin repeat protein
MQASRRGHGAVVKCLVTRGADVTVADRFGDTAADFAEDPRVKAILAEGSLREFVLWRLANV